MVVSCSYLIFLEGQGSWDAPLLGVRCLLFHCLFDVWCFCVVFMKPGASWPMGAKKLPDESGGNQSVAPQVRPGGLKHRRNDSARQRMSTHLLIQASALRPKSTTDCSLDSWTTQGNSLCIISFLDSFQWVWSKYTSAMKSIRVFTVHVLTIIHSRLSSTIVLEYRYTFQGLHLKLAGWTCSFASQQLKTTITSKTIQMTQANHHMIMEREIMRIPCPSHLVRKMEPNNVTNLYKSWILIHSMRNLGVQLRHHQRIRRRSPL